MIIRLKYKKSYQGIRQGQLSVYIGPDRNHLMISGQLMLFDEEMYDLLTLLKAGAKYKNRHIGEDRFVLETEGIDKDLTRKLDLED